MSIQLSSRTFKDIYGNIYSLYKANSGDDLEVRIDFLTSVSTSSSVTNQMNFSIFTKEVNRTSGSWIDDGFRIGDSVTFIEKDSTNATTKTATLIIESISDKQIIVSGLPSLNGYYPSSGFIWYFFTNKQFKELEINLNWIENLLNITFDSPIDQEAIKLVYKDLDLLAVSGGLGAGADLIQVGKRSGSFAVNNPKIWRLSDQIGLDPAQTLNKYTIVYNITDIGLLFPSFYTGLNNINFIENIKLKVENGDSFFTSLTLSDPSNTGYFNEGFNDEASIVTSKDLISNLYYNDSNIISLQISVNDLTISEIEIGACYNTINENYNQNVSEDQSKLLYLLKTGLIGVSDIGSVFTDVTSNVNLTLDNFSFSDASGIRTFIIDFTIDFSSSFENFIEDQGSFDRLYNLWLKTGNTNSLVYNNQLLFSSPVGSQFIPNKFALINHDNNNNYSDNSFFPIPSSIKIDSDINIEDDLAYFIDFELNINDNNQAVIVELFACDSSDNNEMIVESFSFDLTDQDLNYFVRLSSPISNNLPTSSAKKEAYLQVKTPLDTLTGIIELRLYYSFIIRWENWIQQINALPFYKSKNIDTKNWKNFSDLLNYDTKFNLRTKIRRNGVNDFFKFWFSREIQDYNGSDIVSSNINIYELPSLAPKTSILRGKQYLIEAVHSFDPLWDNSRLPYIFGDIRIEQSESAPFFLMSTEIDTDVNSINPLYGINNNRLELDYSGSYIFKLTCYLDTNKLQGSDQCISSRISDNGEIYNPVEAQKITEDSILKITEDSNQKIIN